MVENGNNVPRRTQYSSCDQCRRSRVACDAGKGRRDGGTAALVSCSRCTNRGVDCTFDWMNHAILQSNGAPKPNKARLRTSRSEQSSSRLPGFSAFITNQISDRTHMPFVDESKPICDIATSACLRKIYLAGFETVFGSWMGRHSNPFLFGEHSPAEVCVSLSQVCEQLDKWMEEESLSSHYGQSEQIKQSLNLSIEAFAARWLPLLDDHVDADLIPNLWRAARRDMLKVINRPAYRSIWALLLFALTPIPVNVSDDEASDGISGQSCVHAALQQIQTLRARQRSLQFNGAQVNVTVVSQSPEIYTSPRSLATANFITAESAAYWAALTFDTSASLTLSCRPLLSSGLFGYSSESSWQMVRTCRGVFQETAASWSPDSEMTDDRANQIIAAGAAWKLLVWKMIANLKEALRDGHDEPEVSAAFNAVMEAVDQWNSTYRDLLSACQKRILFLAQETKLRWYELVMHYHLSLLIGVDMLAATERDDLLAKFAANRVEAESWVLNCLVFGLNNTYSITTSDTKTTTTTTTTKSIVAFDPYAHHVVAAVKLMQQALERDLAASRISPASFRDLAAILTRALQQLPSSSRSVQAARENAPSQGLYSLASMGG